MSDPFDQDQAEILIIDDTPENLRLLGSVLKEAGYLITMAKSGIQGLQAARKHQPDLILLDIRMPEMDGFEVLTRLCEEENLREIPVVFLTAHSDEESILRGLSLGAVDYVKKPFSPSELLLRVRNHLELKFHRDYQNAQKELLAKRVEEELAKRLQSEKLLLRQNKLAHLGEMLGIITHQWKQPLNILSLHNHLLLDWANTHLAGKELERLQRFHDEMSEQIHYMSTTVDDFRNFLRQNKVKDLTTIERTFEECKSIIQPDLIKHKITLEIITPAQSLSLYCYKNELKQALLNLLSNSRDAIIERGIKEGKITLEAKAIVHEKGKKSLMITLLDNGGGISAEPLEVIFDPDFTTKEEGKGTGIGLYMTKMIIEDSLQGEITVQNESEGALFTLTLPCLVTP